MIRYDECYGEGLYWHWQIDHAHTFKGLTLVRVLAEREIHTTFVCLTRAYVNVNRMSSGSSPV